MFSSGLASKNLTSLLAILCLTKSPNMSSVQCLREFVHERLTAAAEEILGVFLKTIIDYEEEIDRQRKLLDGFVLKPETKLHKKSTKNDI